MKKLLKKSLQFFMEYGISISLFLVIGVFVVFGLRSAQIGQQEESLRIAQESIVRAAVSCYALEGNYPSTYEYLKENYGVQVDEKKYTVFYQIFASNLMPDVTVTQK